MPEEIYDIPPSSPSYNVTYVTIEEDDDDDEWVTFAYVAGYTGMMIAWGCAVWGTGWYYPPYVRYGGFYPVYTDYPHLRVSAPGTTRRPAHTDAARGVYGPYGGAGVGAALQPAHRDLRARRRGVRPVRRRAAWRRRTIRAPARTRRRVRDRTSTATGDRPPSQRGDDWAQTGHVTNNRTGHDDARRGTSSGGGAVTRTGAAGRTTVGAHRRAATSMPATTATSIERGRRVVAAVEQRRLGVFAGRESAERRHGGAHRYGNRSRNETNHRHDRDDRCSWRRQNAFDDDDLTVARATRSRRRGTKLRHAAVAIGEYVSQLAESFGRRKLPRRRRWWQASLTVRRAEPRPLRTSISRS